MKIAITGAKGFLGRHLVNRLLKNGHSVSILTRDNTNDIKIEGLEVIIGDISEENSLLKLTKNAEIVCNLAAELTNEDKMTSTNYLGTKLLFEQSLKSGVRSFIQLSSVGVYGAVTDITSEEQELAPLNKYEISKSLADKWLLENFREGTNLIILRPSIIFGSDMKNSHLKELINRIKANSYFFIGKKDYYVNYIYYENVLDSIETLINDISEYNYARIYNLNISDSLESFISSITDALNMERVRRRLPRLLVYLIVLVFNLINRITGLQFPFTLNRYKSLTSSAIYDSSKFFQDYGMTNNFRISNKEGIEKCIMEWNKKE